MTADLHAIETVDEQPVERERRSTSDLKQRFLAATLTETSLQRTPAMSTGTRTSPIVDDPQGLWIADCPACGKSFDITELGYRRANAFSYALRRSMTCPKCHATNGMNIKHVDRNGAPDQPLAYVVRKALILHAKIWGTFLLVGAAVLFVVSFLIELLKSR